MDTSLLPFLRDKLFNRGENPTFTSLIECRYRDVLESVCGNFLLEPLDILDKVNLAGTDELDWSDSLRQRVISYLTSEPKYTEVRKQELLAVGLAALYAFLQVNVTGPPLEWSPSQVCLGKTPAGNDEHARIRRTLVSRLSSDGIAAYHLTQHVELFALAQAILTHSSLCAQETPYVWARLRVNFIHQQLLNEASSPLQALIFQDLSFLDSYVLSGSSTYDSNAKVLYLLERAAINTFHGFDKKAREDLSQVTRVRQFQYGLTGRLGKRTKFQQHDISQLVVLARSGTRHEQSGIEEDHTVKDELNARNDQPKNLDLNDDTLLERISFSEDPRAAGTAATEGISPALAELDPSNQPPLDSLDAIILLSTASSITNTSPEHGLTREETMPYATRVLQNGSPNWQIFTQALLVRSRIEGYRSRTVERGVLQLQALVDQIIAETTSATNRQPESSESATTFLPRPKESESASVSERLMYVHQLASPLTWALESELASRWTSLGGLRTALEIFERLELWAEAALCWAATDREDKARLIVRKQLFRSIKNVETKDDEDGRAEDFLGDELSPLPPDAPRLFCILGDLEKEPRYYERAWDISNKRYARAQRSLGKYYLATREMQKADEAYTKSLAINPQNAAVWFSLGCVRLETMDWKGAVQAFTRSVQIEDDDAEAWSNLAAALMRLPVDDSQKHANDDTQDTHESFRKVDQQKHLKEAFVAFKKASAIKRDSYRIWQNLLNVGATLSPPPYSDLVVAQHRLIELRSKTEGEGCIDVEILEGILAHIVANGRPQTNGDADTEQSRRRFGLENMFTDLVQKHVLPLITQSRRLWQLVARLAIYQNNPASALDAYEKGWRATSNKPGWDRESEISGASNGTADSTTSSNTWKEVVDSTIELVDAYESLGEKETTEGLGAGSRELVCKNWKYKARMAIRSVISRRTKAGFEDFKMLQERMDSLKS